MNHYIYRVEEKFTKEFYWGVRSCECDPSEDTYTGSMIRWKPIRENLIKTFIKTFETRELAKEAEHIVLKYFMNKDKFPLNRNYHDGNAKFGASSNKGEKLKPFSEKHRMNISLAMSAMKGKKRTPSPETRLKLSKALKGKPQKRKSS